MAQRQVGAEENRLRVKTRVQDAKAREEEEEKEIEEPVSPASKMFQEEATDVSIFCILEFKNPLELARLRDFLKRTLVKHKRFRSVVKGLRTRSAKWVPVADVDLGYHVVEISVSEEEAKSRNPFESCASRLVSGSKLDWSKPLWRVYVANLPQGPSQSACIFHIHHSLGDGTSLMSLLLACARQTQNPELLPTIPGKSKSETLGSVQPHTDDTTNDKNLASKTSQDAQNPFDSSRPNELNKLAKKEENGMGALFALLLNSLIHIYQFLAMLAWRRDSPTCIKGGAGNESLECQVASSPELLLSDVTKIRKAVYATVNDVLLTVVAGGLHLYLKKRSESKPVSQTLLRALLTVNIRESPGLQELQLMLEKKSKARWGNQMGNILLAFDVDEEQHPLDRLKKTKKICDSKKNSLEAVYSHYNGRLVVSSCGAKVVSKLIYRSLTQTTFALSNMVGPAEEISLDGNPITAILPTVRGCPQSLVVHFQSYNGKVKFFISAIKKYIPDPHELCDCFMEAFMKMKDSL